MNEVTGVILAGGRGQRMGGLDKGLQPFLGRRLIDHAVDRLKPQVKSLLIVANRHGDIYAELGYPVVDDASANRAGPDDKSVAVPGAYPRFEGPMVGLMAGLMACETPWLVTVPCDSPLFPSNLVERLLAAASRQGGGLAVAAIQGQEGVRLQPVFSLVHVTMHARLRRFLETGQRRFADWLIEQKAEQVLFDQPDDFGNVNTLEDLDDLAGKLSRS